MKQTILYISAFLGNIINYLSAFPKHLKKKFTYDLLVQLKTIIPFLLLYSIIYFYFGFTKYGWFSHFSFGAALGFFLLSFLFYGLLLSKNNSNLDYPLYKYFSDTKNGKIVLSKKSSPFIKKELITTSVTSIPSLKREKKDRNTNNSNTINNYYNSSFKFHNKTIINSDINFYNKTEINSSTKNNDRGPKRFSKSIFIALKYYILHQKDKNQRQNDFQVSNEAFFKKIANEENINWGTLKGNYTKLVHYTFENLLDEKKYKKYIIPLLKDKELNENDTIIAYIKKFDNE